VKRLRDGAAAILIAALLIAAGRAVLLPDGPATRPGTISYSEFRVAVEEGRIASITLTDAGTARGLLSGGVPFEVYLPAPGPDLFERIVDTVPAARVEPAARTSPWLILILSVLPILVIVLLVFLFLIRPATSDQAAAMGKSRARLVSGSPPRVSFRDVAGADEAKEELQEVVVFLKEPKVFHELGARIPRGVLLVGPPGCGKTHLAKAVAGEAKVPFFSISGSDFVEMFVGVGAARVRDLFEQAKRQAPCIIFIDEIDAVGRKRGAGLGGGNDEREQTLNQLLVELDGFETKDDVIIMAATNRPDVLDPALLRPGRFDRQIVVDAPDVKGREEILKVHARKKPLDESVDLRVVARRTPGFSGADLENLLNEAALIAARHHRKRVLPTDLEEAADRVTMGPERKSRRLLAEQLRQAAVHETGHAVVACSLEHAERPERLSVVPRGAAQAYMLAVREDRPLPDRAQLEDSLAVAMGGLAAEELLLSETTSAVAADLRRATRIARAMVTDWGMSPRIGRVSAANAGRDLFTGRPLAGSPGDRTLAVIDAEVRGLLVRGLRRARAVLTGNLEATQRVAEELVAREQLTGAEVAAILDGRELPPLPAPESARPEPAPADEPAGLRLRRPVPVPGV
jgi:cell division protease FtsH